MSHVPQRKEKDCLNCGTIVQGRYCHVCGQENVVPKEGFWHMVTHFFYDITHFDSKFFETVKDLLFKPGFLSKEYMMGRRARYLHPVKMYVFTSAVFFLLFFSVVKPDDAFSSNLGKPLTSKERNKELKKVQKKLDITPGDRILLKQLVMLQDTARLVTVAELLGTSEDFTVINFTGNKYKTFKEYDSAEQSLPPSERDGWMTRRLVAKEISLNTRYGANPEEGLRKLGESVLHRLPYMLFISLPLFALLLKFLYWRRKNFYYADHGIFTIHLYIFSFILLAAVFGLDKLDDMIHSGFIGLLMFLLFVALFFYLYKAMRNFYQQRRAKTFIKFLLLSFISMIMMTILFVLFLFFSAFTF